MFYTSNIVFEHKEVIENLKTSHRNNTREIFWFLHFRTFKLKFDLKIYKFFYTI